MLFGSQAACARFEAKQSVTSCRKTSGDSEKSGKVERGNENSFANSTESAEDPDWKSTVADVPQNKVIVCLFILFG